jgi:peptide deformylase
MAIRKVARLGHPVLRQKGRELTASEIRSPAIKRLVEDMIETMKEYGGIGIAAPQVHESLQLALIGFGGDNERYPDQEGLPLTVVVNPRITVLDKKEQGFWEGCLSVPELRGLVYRPRKIRVDYLDLRARKGSIVAEGFLATVFQHELDHLAGTLFVDRVRAEPGKTPLAFTAEYQKYLVPQDDDDVGELAD